MLRTLKTPLALPLITVLAAGLAACSASNETPPPVNQSPTAGTGNQGAAGNAGSTNQMDVPDIIDTDETNPLSAGLCGNGVYNQNEACDDSNTDPGDGCDANCQVEQNYICDTVGVCTYVDVCGDGIIGAGETCDDGNEVGEDGCSAGCITEADWACPAPGTPCIYTVSCGDGRVSGAEECDDYNTNDGDGCGAICNLEVGFECPRPGAPCTAVCGDGMTAGQEDCDDGNTNSGDGCDAACHSELGWECDAAGCHEAVCGDGIIEGGESCDDGDDVNLGDGCSPGCKIEPNCSGGACVSSCGDGIILANDTEDCDDGNNKNGDGCDEFCKFEAGFDCVDEVVASGNVITLPIVYRDFIGKGWSGGSNYNPPGYQADFENDAMGPEGGAEEQLYGTQGIVNVQLGADGKPVYAATTAAARGAVTSADSFNQWFRTTAGVNTTVLGLIDLRKTGDLYVFDDNNFFPLDGQGFVATGEEEELDKDWHYKGCWDRFEAEHDCGCNAQDDCTTTDTTPPTASCVDKHNFSFTSEVRYWFEYQGGEQLAFRGDDDVWVFINGRLVVDLGGLHEPVNGDVCGNTWFDVEVEPNPADDGWDNVLEGGQIVEVDPPNCAGLSAATVDAAGNPLGLELGKVYEVAVFQAERHTCQSNYQLTLGGFTQRTTTCEPRCGDGVRAGLEACDDGPDNGAGYGFCTASCQPGPRCGDGIIDTAAGEDCDNGVNLDGYYLEADDCAPGCKFPPFCGDGTVDSGFGETCDTGADNLSDTLYDGCNTACERGPRCGDGIEQPEVEQCDDGNRKNGDGCNVECKDEPEVIMY